MTYEEQMNDHIGFIERELDYNEIMSKKLNRYLSKEWYEHKRTCIEYFSKLEKENEEMKERLKPEANEIIKDLLYCTDGIVEVSIPEENRFLSVKKLKARAEKFLKESCE